MSEERSEARPLVLDTSVAVKWYLPEEWHEEAIKLLGRVEAREIDFLSPGTIQPEFFNSLWQQYRYGDCLWIACASHGNRLPRSRFSFMRRRISCRVQPRSHWIRE